MTSKNLQTMWQIKKEKIYKEALEKIATYYVWKDDVTTAERTVHAKDCALIASNALSEIKKIEKEEHDKI